MTSEPTIPFRARAILERAAGVRHSDGLGWEIAPRGYPSVWNGRFFETDLAILTVELSPAQLYEAPPQAAPSGWLARVGRRLNPPPPPEETRKWDAARHWAQLLVEDFSRTLPCDAEFGYPTTKQGIGLRHRKETEENQNDAVTIVLRPRPGGLPGSFVRPRGMKMPEFAEAFRRQCKDWQAYHDHHRAAGIDGHRAGTGR